MCGCSVRKGLACAIPQFSFFYERRLCFVASVLVWLTHGYSSFLQHAHTRTHTRTHTHLRLFRLAIERIWDESDDPREREAAATTGMPAPPAATTSSSSTGYGHAPAPMQNAYQRQWDQQLAPPTTDMVQVRVCVCVRLFAVECDESDGVIYISHRAGVLL